MFLVSQYSNTLVSVSGISEIVSLCLVIDSFLTLNSSSDPRGIFVSQMSARILSRYFGRLPAVSLFFGSLSVEQNARDTQMTTRVTEGTRRDCRPRFSRLGASPLNERVRVHSPY